MDLAVFVGRATKLVHHFRTHRVRRRSYKLEVVLNRFLKQKPAGLSIALGDVRKTFVETDVHLKSNFLGWLLGHRQGFCQEITRRKRIILENSRIVYHPMEVVFLVCSCKPAWTLQQENYYLLAGLMTMLRNITRPFSLPCR
jgi:hypothetical protein